MELPRQQNSTEKTTAPTVMDCVRGIHWLRAASEAATSGTAPQGQVATADGADPMSKGSVWHWPNKDYFLASESRCIQGPQENQDSQIRLEVPSRTD